MSYRFFSKTDNRPKNRFFNPADISTTDDTSASTAIGVARPFDTKQHFTYRNLRLIRSKETLDDLLEMLLRNAENSGGLARDNFLEQLLRFLKRNPDFINRVPNKFHSNPLELVIRLGDLVIAKELLNMKANVRPANRDLLKLLQDFLQSAHLKEEAQSRMSARK